MPKLNVQGFLLRAGEAAQGQENHQSQNQRNALFHRIFSFLITSEQSHLHANHDKARNM